MPYAKVTDIAYARLQSPSLDEAEEFLVNFGMKRAERTRDTLYMRGTDPDHHIHVTHLGPPKFRGFAFSVESEDDLKRFAKAPGASGIEHIDEPGGGMRVRVSDPHGYQMEVVCGMATLPPLPTRRNIVNTGDQKLRRAGELMRLPRGPSRGEAHRSRRHDGAGRGAGDQVVSRDVRPRLLRRGLCRDRRTTSSPPSTAATAARPMSTITSSSASPGPKVGLNHISFEVQSIDDVMLGHEHLKQAGKYKQVWGIGRHVLGSQVFDYWQDPWGRVHEHWTDTDISTSMRSRGCIRSRTASIRSGATRRRRNSSTTRRPETLTGRRRCSAAPSGSSPRIRAACRGRRI